MSYQQAPAGWNAQHQTGGFDPQRPQQAPQSGTNESHRPPARLGAFTLREALIFLLTILLVIVSFLPLVSADGLGYTNLWSPLWLLGIPGVLLPLAAAVLILLQRTSPATRWRVGSLSADQFASVSAVVAAATYLGTVLLVAGIGSAINDAFSGWISISVIPGVGPVLGLILALGLIVVTTLAPMIPPFKAEFRARASAPAHVTARPIAALPRRQPAMNNPVPQQSGPHGFPQHPYPQQPGQPANWQPYAQPNQPHPGNAAPQQQPHAQAPQQPEFSSAPRSASPRAPQPAAPDVASSDAPHRDKPAGEAVPDAAATTLGNAYPEDIEATVLRPLNTNPDLNTAEPKPAAAEAADAGSKDSVPLSASSHVNADAATESQNAPSTGPFWVWSPAPREVVDESSGAVIFSIGPTAWALAVDDRGSELVIRHDDGRVGVLRDIEGLTRS